MAKRYDPDNVSEQEETAAPDPWAILDRLTAAMERLSQAPATDQNRDLLEKLSGALERVSDSSLAGAKLVADETRRAHRPSNEVVHKRSVYNLRGETLEGYEKPKLRCVMMVPFLVENESVTREEVELLNLLEPGEFTIKRIDGSKVKVAISVTYGLDNVTPSRLLLTHETAFNNDNFKLLPPMSDTYRQILNQTNPEARRRGLAVLTMDEEAALIAAGELTVAV